MRARDSPETKKPKHEHRAEARAPDSDSLDRLDDFCLSLVLSMIGNARDLFRLAFCSKRLVSVVEHEHVVRAAILSGDKKVRAAVRDVVSLAHERKIFAPSPIRLLRFVNGKTCEGRSKHGMPRGCRCRNQGEAKFGVFFCRDCFMLQHCMGLRPAMTTVRENHEFLSCSPRVLSIKSYGRHMVWARPFVDDSGEACGPIISLRDYEKVTSGEIKATLEDRLAENDQMDRFKGKIEVMTIASQHAWKRHQDMEAELKEAKKRHNVLCVHQKVDKVQKLLKDIGNVMGEVPWKSVALSCVWYSEESCSRNPREAVGELEARISHGIMGHIFACPRKASTKKEKKRIAAQVNEKFEAIYEKNFHDLSFLSKQAATDPLFHCLWSYYKDTTPMNDPDHFLKHMDERMSKMIRESRLFEALAWRFHYTDCLGFLYPSYHNGSSYSIQMREIFRDAFASSKKHKLDGVDSDREQSLEHNRDIILAGSTWTYCGSRLPVSLGLEETVRRQYEDSVRLFPRLRSALAVFVKDKSTLSFCDMEKEVDPSASDRKTWVCFGAWGCPDVFDFLLEGSFGAVQQHLLKRKGHYDWEDWRRVNLLPVRPGMVFRA